MKAELIINKNYIIGEIDKRLYGSFIEHLGRAVYGGIYEPEHPSADDQGFRGDVIEQIKRMNVPIVRYPGGNFVSGYRWEDGIGDKSKRPRRMELSWFSTEPNQVGIDEFQEWVKRADSEVMMAVNLGTRGPEEAMNCVEYCNATSDTYYANLRRENGFEAPFKIKTWCLGNEMDGPWQMGHKTADEYGRVATEAAKLMKWVDPDIELVACGSSKPDMRTYIDWERTVLEHTYNYVDYISLHSYYSDHYYSDCEDPRAFLASSEIMDGFIKTVAAICDIVKAKKRTNKTVNLSFDEWNVWHNHDLPKGEKKWSVAPPILEDQYTFIDALVVGCLLITLQNNCDRVKMACLAQLVNVIAPIMTENGGRVWLQTTFYPFMYSSNNGRGVTMKPVVRCDSYETKRVEKVPYLATSVINNEEKKEIVVFAVNRSIDEDMELDISIEHFGECKLSEHVELYADDLKVINSVDEDNVLPENVEIRSDGKIILKKHSWNMLRFKY